MQQKEVFLAQKELEVKELRLQLVEKEQDLSMLEETCDEIVLEAEKNDRIQAEIEANLKSSRLLMENLALREKQVAAREKEIKSFRRHGKGTR